MAQGLGRKGVWESIAGAAQRKGGKLGLQLLKLARKRGYLLRLLRQLAG